MFDMTQTAQATLAEQNADQTQAPIDPVAEAQKKLNQEFKSRIEVCKQYRKRLIPNWMVNIDYRRGKPFASQTDEDRIAVPLDWSRTKHKHASLFSQVPEVRVDHPPQSLENKSTATYQNRLNDNLKAGGISAAMREVIPDCVNAAGFGSILVSHDAITEEVEIPLGDPTLGGPPETIKVPRVVEHKYCTQRISPADLLWPLTFTGSDFDNAPWIGRSGRVTWAEAQRLWNLSPEEKSKVVGDARSQLDQLTQDVDKERANVEDEVGFDEIWYKEHKYDAAAKSYDLIHHLVFINNKNEPVVDEPWNGQKTTEQGLIGAIKYPIRVLTLTYITDETIPPSDTAMGRPQVDEINKGRGQMIAQRQRSLPLRWFDINRLDTTIGQAMMRGTWQGIVPVQGDGSRIIGEVARANMPQENFEFDRIARSDVDDTWSLGPNQAGSGRGIETASEADSIQTNYQTRISMERAMVAEFVAGVAEVLGGLMVIYEDPSSFGEGFDPTISKALTYSILPDATVLLDSNQKIKKLVDFINFTAKSGWVSLEPVLKEIASLSGLDPNVVIQPPQPKPPVEPAISIRLTGSEDMTNPLVLATIMKSGQAPSPDLIEQAKQLILMATQPPATFTPPPTPPQQGAVEPQPPPPPVVGEANPKWEAMPRINKRADGEEGGY